MSEIKQVKEMTNPAETILVADSLTGQIAVNVAKEFDTAVNIFRLFLQELMVMARWCSIKHETCTGNQLNILVLEKKYLILNYFIQIELPTEFLEWEMLYH